MDGFEGEKVHLVLYPVADWQPVELPQDRCNVGPAANPLDDACRRILNSLEAIDGTGGGVQREGNCSSPAHL